MYIIAIGWIYVIFMMAITEKSVIAGLLTFFFYGVLPLVIILWLGGAPQRARNRAKAARESSRDTQPVPAETPDVRDIK